MGSALQGAWAAFTSRKGAIPSLPPKEALLSSESLIKKTMDASSSSSLPSQSSSSGGGFDFVAMQTKAGEMWSQFKSSSPVSLEGSSENDPSALIASLQAKAETLLNDVQQWGNDLTNVSKHGWIDG